ncbi:RNA-directed DNA polymerase [uncultured Imperialibacter sp.]|uniref:RNA-directed DNA polymerase n=1 Tax=uncultured Imperialibacter sp. TaxID=1672639 RepID=UPI0030DC7061|tara:strand:+ start:42526 stop:45507 length:2982 start_codon:yes stop_codon:yes gene_type:complete
MLSKEEVKRTFLKLQNYSFYDNYNLHLRYQIAEFKAILLKDEYYSFPTYKEIGGLVRKIGLRFYPKEVKTDSSSEGNFITNEFLNDTIEIGKVQVFIDIPIELHLLCVHWLLEHGKALDAELSDDCYGNRLTSQEEGLGIGRGLFKPYNHQYDKWWNNAIKYAKRLLDEKKDVSIITFDLTSFFHNVRFNLDELDDQPDVSLGDDRVHKIFKSIHEKYYSLISEALSEGLRSEPFPLPIGLITSPVLANWYLRKFDEQVKTRINPEYYGRYVDDFVIVLKNVNIKKAEIDSDSEGLKKEKRSKVEEFIHEHLSGILKLDEKGKININNKEFEHLGLNISKLYLYQFSAKNSPTLIDKLIQDQKERSSEFRFLSDDNDDSYEDFELSTFESTFDGENVNKAKFSHVADNKFKVSAFLTKLISRRIINGSNYKADQIDKIDKYFKGHYLIKNWHFWEKLFTLFLVAGDKTKFITLYNHIFDILEDGMSVMPDQFSPGPLTIQDALKDHLQYSMFMAIGLNPGFLLGATFRDVLLSSKIRSSLTDFSIFRKTGLIRNHFVVHPLLQFTEQGRKSNTNLTHYASLDQAIFKREKDFLIVRPELLPFRVKFYQVSYLTFLRNLYTNANFRDITHKQYLDESFLHFSEINELPNEGIRDLYFQLGEHNSIRIEELKVPENVPSKKACTDTEEGIRIALVNKYVDSKEFLCCLDDKPIVSEKRTQVFLGILDSISKVPKLDLFVLPELALPNYMLPRYLIDSARKQVGFVSGLEFIRISDTAYNLVATSLPVIVDGDRDVIFTFRLKNFYAPEEKSVIENKRINIPKPLPKYHLFEWRKAYFSVYNCYELAEINHRALLYSKVDFIVASVWNRDINYFNSIVDSASRDLHCYFVQSNTSQYGDSRVTRPTKTERRDQARIKGGTVADYPFTLIVADLEIGRLRQFQLLTHEGQKEWNRTEKKDFKQTPPDFPVENVEKRMAGEMFFKEEIKVGRRARRRG